MPLPIEMELRKLGLNEKEVKVYLAGLELGTVPVKKLSEFTKIPRATVYEILKSLKEKGFFEESKVGKRRVFVAKSPREILVVLKLKKKEIEEKEREFIRIIGILEGKYTKEKEIEILGGKKAFELVLENLSFTQAPKIVLINQSLIPISEPSLKKTFQSIKKRLGKIIIEKIEAKIDGGMIIFDKIVYFPKGEKKCILLK